MKFYQIGVQKNDPCHRLSYVKDVGVKKVEEYENDEIEIIRLRAGQEEL